MSLVEVHTFDEVRRAVRSTSVSLVGHPRFDGSLAALLRWARETGYFHGQMNRIREEATLRLRNSMQDTEHDALVMPPQALRSLGLLFQWIQWLWGYPTPSSDAYPGPVPRQLHVVGMGPLPGEAAWFHVEHPAGADTEASQRSWYIVLATDGAPLGGWRPRFECISTPVAVVRGPGSWDDLTAVVDHYGAARLADTVELLDRLFLIRTVPGSVEPPRSPSQVRALRDRRAGERWAVLRADSPVTAAHHISGYTPGPHAEHGECHSCAVEVIMDKASRSTIDTYVRRLPSRLAPTLTSPTACTAPHSPLLTGRLSGLC